MSKVVLFDIDGTLLINNAYPNDFGSIKILIKKLYEKSYRLGICTNRPLDNDVIKVYRDYELCGPVITEGGCCLYNDKDSKFILDKFFDKNNNLYYTIYEYVYSFVKKNHIVTSVCLKSKYINAQDAIVINDVRLKTTTIKIPKLISNIINHLIIFLKNKVELLNYIVEKDDFNNLKINIYPKFINKVVSINKFLKDEDVTLITDYERIQIENELPTLLKIYSIGTDEYFNSCCTQVFSTLKAVVKAIINNK